MITRVCAQLLTIVPEKLRYQPRIHFLHLQEIFQLNSRILVEISHRKVECKKPLYLKKSVSLSLYISIEYNSNTKTK